NLVFQSQNQNSLNLHTPYHPPKSIGYWAAAAHGLQPAHKGEISMGGMSAFSYYINFFKPILPFAFSCSASNLALSKAPALLVCVASLGSKKSVSTFFFPNFSYWAITRSCNGIKNALACWAASFAHMA